MVIHPLSVLVKDEHRQPTHTQLCRKLLRGCGNSTQVSAGICSEKRRNKAKSFAVVLASIVIYRATYRPDATNDTTWFTRHGLRRRKAISCAFWYRAVLHSSMALWIPSDPLTSWWVLLILQQRTSGCLVMSFNNFGCSPLQTRHQPA